MDGDDTTSGTRRRRHRTGNRRRRAYGAGCPECPLRPRPRARTRGGRPRRPRRQRHHRHRRGAGQGASGRRRRPGARLGLRLSTAGRGRAQHLRRLPQGAGPLCQYPTELHPRRRARDGPGDGPGDRAREPRRLLRRPLHAPGAGRIHAVRGHGPRRRQDHYRGLDPHRPRRLRAGPAAAQAGHHRPQGQRAAHLLRPFPCLRAQGRRGLPGRRGRRRHH